MITEDEFKNGLNIEELETIRKEIIMEKIYEIMERERIYDVFPNYDLQDETLTRNIIEVYKIIFWGASAIISTLLWLYFFLM